MELVDTKPLKKKGESVELMTSWACVFQDGQVNLVNGQCALVWVKTQWILKCHKLLLLENICKY